MADDGTIALNSPDTAILLKDVNLTLGAGLSRIHVLKDINLSLPTGCSLALAGPSGSGKSSVLMVACGLERVQSGQIIIAGCDIARLTEDQLATFRGQNIGIVFQSFHLIPTMTVLENVAAPLELAGAPRALERAKDELDELGLSDRLGHYPTGISGGEQQRVALARALVTRPRLLLADEPTGNLDKETGDMAADLLFEQQQKRNMSLFLVTHDPKLAERCDMTLRIVSGHI